MAAISLIKSFFEKVKVAGGVAVQMTDFSFYYKDFN